MKSSIYGRGLSKANIFYKKGKVNKSNKRFYISMLFTVFIEYVSKRKLNYSWAKSMQFYIKTTAYKVLRIILKQSFQFLYQILTLFVWLHSNIYVVNNIAQLFSSFMYRKEFFDLVKLLWL